MLLCHRCCWPQQGLQKMISIGLKLFVACVELPAVPRNKGLRVALEYTHPVSLAHYASVIE